MNDKDFDQIFSDKLNEESAFSGADENWQKLNFRLDLVAPMPAPALPAPPVPTIGGQSRWMYAAMSALTVGNVWLWLQMRDVNRQNEALQKAVATVQANGKDTIYRIDTIYQKMYLIDNHSNSEGLATITPTEYAALSAARIAQNRATDAASSKSIESKNLKNRIVIENKKQQNIDNSLLSRSDKPVNDDNNAITANSKTVNPTKSVDKVVLNKVSTENNFSKQTERGIVTTVSKDINKVDNTTLSTGAANGTTNAATPSIADLTPSKTVDAAEIQNNVLDKTNLLLLPLDTKPLLPVEALEKEVEAIQIAGVRQPIKVRKQYNILRNVSMPEVNIGIVGSVGRLGKYETDGLGIGTDIGLSRNWSIIASAEKHEAHFEMRDRNDRFHLPKEPIGASGGSRLMALEGNFRDFRLSLGAKYVFLTPKKFRPYILAQHVWKKAPPSFVAFKYEKQGGGKEEFFEPIESKSFANIWQAGAGMVGDFNNRFSWNAGLNYMFDFNATNHNTNPLTLRAGVYYRL